MSNNIEGKAVVITGASSGPGETTARHLSAENVTVAPGAPPVLGLVQQPLRRAA
jgi:NADP-dependent 3-hydroxy acid dehydrogenase YdfG